MKALLKGVLAFGVVAALSVGMISCEQGETATKTPTEPTGPNLAYVYLDTSSFTGDAVRIHMHANKRIAATLSIYEIFGSASMTYDDTRTAIQTFDAGEASGDYYWDRTINVPAALETVAGALTFSMTDDSDTYVYCGTIGAAGFTSPYIGMVVDADEWATFTAPTTDAEGAGAIRFEFMDTSSSVVKGAQDITELFVAAQ